METQMKWWYWSLGAAVALMLGMAPAACSPTCGSQTDSDGLGTDDAEAGRSGCSCGGIGGGV